MNVLGQSASVTFVTDQNSRVCICKPVDGQYTNEVIDKEFNLVPNVKSIYRIDVDKFMFLHCEFDEVKICDLFLIPGDSLIIKKTGSELSFEGTGAKETTILNKEYGLYIGPLARLIIEMKDPVADYPKIKPTMDSCIFQFCSYIDQIKEFKLSPLFREMIKKSFCGHIQSYSLMSYGGILINGRELPHRDSLKILNLIEDICNKINIHDVDLLKTIAGQWSLIPDQYLRSKYSNLSDQEKEDLFKNKDIEKEAYGNSKYLILAPNDIKPFVLGGYLYMEYRDYKNDINKEKLYTYYKEKYPQSEYIKAIDKLKTEIQEKKETIQQNDSIIFINEKINSLKELLTYSPFKGKYIFVDVWATWCIPCIKEFQYKDSLSGLLKNYKDLIMVYISIDDDRSNDYWKIKTTDYNLEGYNLRASEALHKDIAAKVTGENTFSVPQYLLLDKEGNVISKDLPRPSELDRLKKNFDNLVK